MKKYRLAAVDMDGTLLDNAHSVTPYTRRTLERLGEAVAVCTGRAMSEMAPHAENLSAVRYIICETGGCVYDAKSGVYLRETGFDPETVREVLALSKDLDCVRQCFTDGQSYMELTDFSRLAPCHIAHFEEEFKRTAIFVNDLSEAVNGRVGKINLYFSGADERDIFKERAKALPLALCGSIGIGLEIAPQSANKAEGLRALCDILNLPIEETMAIGDGDNDRDLLRAAGFAVAMANAVPAIREMADTLTEDNEHDGAAKALERYMQEDNRCN